MYTKFYGFKKKPFNITPDPSDLYQSPNHKRALAHLEYGLLDQVGLTLLTGDVGTGKTTIIRYVVENYCKDLQVGVIFNTNVSPNDFFRLILSSFNLESSDSHKNQQLNRFKLFLEKKRTERNRILIIIDEAQGLSDETLEEVRLLSNIQIDYSDVMQIMLMGQPELLDRIHAPQWVSLGQRIGVNFHLEALDHQQSCRYIAHRIERAGANKDLFSKAALGLIYKYANGIPRLINLICDAALVYGYGDDLSAIDASIIETVVKERSGIGLKNELVTFESGTSKNHTIDNNEHIETRFQELEEELYLIKNQLTWQKEALALLIPRSKNDLIATAKSIIAKERRMRKELELEVMRLKQLLKTKTNSQADSNNAKHVGAPEVSAPLRKNISKSVVDITQKTPGQRDLKHRIKLV